jgi:hypothetical protein
LEGIDYPTLLRWMLGKLASYSLRGVIFTCDASQQLENGWYPIKDGQQWLELYDMDVDAKTYLAVLIGITIQYGLLAYVVLKFSQFRWQEVSDR